MVATIGSAEYALGADLKPLQKGLASAESAIKKSGKTAEDAFGRQGTAAANKLASSQGLLVKQSSELRKGILAGVGIGGGILAFGMLKSAVTGVVGAFGDAVKASAEEEVGIAKLTAALEANVAGWNGNRDGIEAVIDTRERLGFSDDEQRESMALLVASTKDVTKALDLQRIAMDLSRLRGTELAETSVLISKVYQGNLSSLKRFGISLGDVKTSTEALAKIQGLAAGQAEKYADTSIAAGEIMAAEWANVTESFGAALTPLATDIARFLSDVAQGVDDALNQGSFGEEGFKAWAEGYRDVAAAAKELGVENDALRYDLGMIEDMLADVPVFKDLAPHIAEAVQMWREHHAELQRAGVDFQTWRMVFFQLKDEMGLGSQKALELTLQWAEAATAGNRLEQVTANLTGRQSQLAVEYARASATGDDLALTEEELEEQAKTLADAIDSLANTSFKSLREEAKATQEAIDSALKHDNMKQLAKEEKQLAAERRKAVKEREWDAVAVIEARQKEIDALQKEHRVAVAGLKAEHEAQVQRKNDIDTIQKELGVSKDKAKELYQQVSKDYTIKMLVQDAQLDAALTKIRTLVSLAASTLWAGIPWGKADQRASGGPVGPGAYQINERGTEMLLMGGHGYVLDAGKTAAVRGAQAATSGRIEHVHRIDAASAGNLRAAGYDERGVASLLRQAARDAGQRYRWS
jgi:hypothetical protein